MGKPISKRIVRGSACFEYAENDVGLVSCAAGSLQTPHSYRLGVDRLDSFFLTGELAAQFVNPTTYRSYLSYLKKICIDKISHNNRICGLILDDNDDGSYKVAILGSDVITNHNMEQSAIVVQIGTETVDVDDNDAYNFAGIPIYNGTANDPAFAWVYVMDGSSHANNMVSIADLFDVHLNFGEYQSSYIVSDTLFETCKYRGNAIEGNDYQLQLSTNKNNTLVGGIPINEMTTVAFNSHCFMYDTYNTIFDAWEGNFYELIDNIYQSMRLQSVKKPSALVSEGNLLNIFTRADLTGNPKLAGYEGKTHAFNFTPFNLILTRSESQALAYIENGTLPSDAFLYPMDWENMPRTDGTPTGGDDDGGGTTPPSGENGDDGIDGDPTVDSDPVITPNMLNNNNYYWLQAGQLESFVRWFWNDAGALLDVGDLWKYLQGLYNDLGQAIINIRYFPVDPQYIGGTQDTSDIIIANISMPMSNVKTLQRRKLSKRTLGTIDIAQRYNAFTDFSPYSELMLYLPFHGWITLDVDLFMKNKCRVKCIYDHVSGTIQYGVYVVQGEDEFLVNTCVAKMAVDIPITLQSKIERDSAIFQNVTNAFGSLVGGGASIATGNPIGLVMATSGIAGGGSMSAPFKINGSVGESGSFFMPNKCCIYIKRPSYNRPSGYAEHVGYPSNQSGKLSRFKGYTTVYNPQITFTGNTNADNVTIKPLQSEIDEIYTALEKGVIL